MGCRLMVTPYGYLALRLQWRLHKGDSVRSQEGLGVSATAENQRLVQRDFVAPLAALIKARQFGPAEYLEWFPHGAKAAEFRQRLGLTVAHVKVSPTREPTVRERYTAWIATKQGSDIRPAQRRDYQQHFTCYILPCFGDRIASELTPDDIRAFRAELTKRLSLKTAANCIQGSFRAFWRDLREAGHMTHDPFKIVWQRVPGDEPDPFSLDERDDILGWFREHRPHYYPFVAVQFLAGLRPSETTALRCRDFDVQHGTLRIRASRYLGRESATKTRASDRTIPVAPELRAILAAHLQKRVSEPDAPLFVNTNGDPLNQYHWAPEHWPRCITALELRYRKFYATRHTFISLALSEGADVYGVARYAGTSVAMIEKHYGKYVHRDGGVASFVTKSRGAKTQRSRVPLRISPKKVAK